MRAQTIFITGAAAGIGCETARLFHARGWQIGVYDVNARGVERLVAELGSGASGGVLDVTMPKPSRRHCTISPVITAASTYCSTTPAFSASAISRASIRCATPLS